MKISLNWLGDFVDLSDHTPQQVADLLSMHTAEVEGVEEYGAELRPLVVGEVVECAPHPAADKLSLTQVDFGAEQTVPVVCGASNVRQGQKIAFAPVGCVLPGGLKIKKAKLRGEASHGMICSGRELELSDDQAGILELACDAEVGRSLAEELGLLDPVLELDNKSLTHRPDLWGHYGFARELAAILGRRLQPLPLLSDYPAAGADPVPIRIEDGTGCSFYAGLRIDLDAPPQASPERIQQRLLATGLRPINDIVDLSNYVMLELGQPTHAFAWPQLAGSCIVVRGAASGEKLTTLDGVERVLDPHDMVIADQQRPVALAGVIGGADSEVGDDTTQLLLESAAFNATSVRRSAHRHGLRSDASARFEKSLDPALADLALRRYCHLLAEIRPQARIVAAPASAGCDEVDLRHIDLDPERCAELLGVGIARDQIGAILQSLGFASEDAGAHLHVRVPSWRASKDVRTAIDLVEEVGRIYGYHKIAEQPLQAPVQAPRADPGRMLERRLVARLHGAHAAYESQGYTFLQHSWAERLGLQGDDFVCVDNPVQDGVDLIRHDPVPTLLEQAVGNLREETSGCLFEIGKGYRPVEQGLPPQRRWLAAVMWRPEGGVEQGPGSLFAAARTVAEDLLRCAGLRRSDPCPGAVDAPWAHPARALTWQDPLALVALLHPRLREELGARRSAIAVVRIDLDELHRLAAAAQPAFRPPSRFPAIKVDVALALPATVPYAEVENALRQAGGRVLEELHMFDLFEGGTLAPGQRSLAFHALLRASDRTLKDKDEQKFLTKVAQAAERLGGGLRS